METLSPARHAAHRALTAIRDTQAELRREERQALESPLFAGFSLALDEMFPEQGSPLRPRGLPARPTEANLEVGITRDRIDRGS